MKKLTSTTTSIPPRREFLRQLFILSASTLIPPYLLSSCTKSSDGLKSDGLKYVPISATNPAIRHNLKACTECSKCLNACKNESTIFGTYNPSKPEPVCIHCGNCVKVCPESAMTEKYNYEDVMTDIDTDGKILVVSTSPAVRAALGEIFDYPAGTNVEKKMVSALRALGFDYVLDTTFGADLTTMEEAAELVERLNTNQNLPLFTSCCPSWVKFVEMYYPQYIQHFSSTKSPIGMQGAMVKEYYAQKIGIPASQIIHVALTPCTAKKYEITQQKMSYQGIQSTDYVLTTKELGILMQTYNISLSAESEYDDFMGRGSGSGVIFGNTGGVMQAALRTAYYDITHNDPPADLIELKAVQGIEGERNATVTIGGKTVNVAVLNGMNTVRQFMDNFETNKTKYHFIEVMNCVGGCINGAGQPLNGNIQKRIEALYGQDRTINRFSYKNPDIIQIYSELLGEPLSTKSKEILHTTFESKANLLT